jgi:hypothetical protein
VQPVNFGPPQLFETPAGEFSIEVPEGNVSLTATSAGYVPAKDIAVDGASRDPLTIKLSHGRTLRGRVVDEKGQPIAGVTLRFNSLGDETPQTLADGSFELRGVPIDEDTDIGFEKSGYVGQQRRLRADPDDVTLEVTLANGIAVTGRVLDHAGAPVAGAHVQASSAAYGANNNAAETDESGSFRIEDLTSARYDFTVEGTSAGERGALKDVDVAKTREVIIRLEKRATATIFGHVSGLNASEQTPNLQRFVSVNNAEGEAKSGQIDADGDYRVESAPAGMVEVMARSTAREAWRTSAKATVDAPPGGEVRVDLAFAPQVTVHGHVTRGGAPLAGATVRFGGPATSSFPIAADGAYVAALDAGEYDVSLWIDEKHLPFTKHVVVKEPAELDFVIESSTLSATVIDADTGQPLAGVSVTLSLRGDTHTVSSATTGRDGMASVDVQQGTPLTVIASKSGYANASENVTPDENLALTLRLSRSPGAVVRVVDVRDGRTLDGYVVAHDAAGRVIASVDRTDPDGTVTLPLAAGAYRFSASAEGYGSHTVEASVPSDEIRVPLTRGGNLSIRSAHDLRGTARLIQPDGEEYVRCWCNGISTIKLEGAMTFVDRISPGAYLLEVTLTGTKPRRVPVTVIEGQTTTVPIE